MGLCCMAVVDCDVPALDVGMEFFKPKHTERHSCFMLV